jgi:hypothetical protein
MCQWSARCDEIGNCKASSPTLGCSGGGRESCETCALGFLNSPMPKDLKAFHRSPYATLGKLTPLGWKITRPGKNSGLEKGDIVTSLNGMSLIGRAVAAGAIAVFGESEVSEVLIDVLHVTDYRLTRREYKR